MAGRASGIVEGYNVDPTKLIILSFTDGAAGTEPFGKRSRLRLNNGHSFSGGRVLM
jgi:hypothetical protein